MCSNSFLGVEKSKVKLTSLGMMSELASVSSQGKISWFQFSGRTKLVQRQKVSWHFWLKGWTETLLANVNEKH